MKYGFLKGQNGLNLLGFDKAPISGYKLPPLDARGMRALLLIITVLLVVFGLSLIGQGLGLL
jgi:hypothetical protein